MTFNSDTMSILPSNQYPSNHPLNQIWWEKISYQFPDSRSIGKFIGRKGRNIKQLCNYMNYYHNIDVHIHVLCDRSGIIVKGKQYDVIRSLPFITETLPREPFTYDLHIEKKILE